MILPLDYMMEFYGINKHKFEEPIPFYCSNHNRDLTKNYKLYQKQLDQCLAMTKKEPENDLSTTYKEPKAEKVHLAERQHEEENNLKRQSQELKEMLRPFELHSEDPGISNGCTNIVMLEHPEFDLGISNTLHSNENFLSNNLFSYTRNISLISAIERPSMLANEDSLIHPVYSFNPKSEKGFSELSFNKSKVANNLPKQNEQNFQTNFAKISKYFYDYFKQDLERVKKERRSNVTITELKELKEFLIAVITAYRHFDSDMMEYYKKLVEEKQQAQ